jgi:hypothetical protein
MNGEEELAKSVSNVIVQVEVVENMDIAVCLNDMGGNCLNSEDNFEITIEANKIQTYAIPYHIENKGNVDAYIALDILLPNGKSLYEATRIEYCIWTYHNEESPYDGHTVELLGITTSVECNKYGNTTWIQTEQAGLENSLYFDENEKEWRIAASPADTFDFPLIVKADDSMDWGSIAIIAREVMPGTYTFTLRMIVTDGYYCNSFDEYHIEGISTGLCIKQIKEITITVNVEGDAPEENSGEEEDDSLLPGPSFISIVAMLAIMVYRRKK